MRLATFVAALLMIAGGLLTDGIGLAILVGVFMLQKAAAKREAAQA
jgi:UPF0716 family protein affecting phage T7 exclusion